MQEKQSKESVNYTDDARDRDEQCKYCEYFRPPMACQKVEGHIARGGWCKLFEEKE
jgi:hypothetical protein